MPDRAGRLPSTATPPTRALREFLATESAGGVLLVAAAAAALVWANSPWQGAYDALWQTTAGVHVGGWELQLDLRHWVNDGLMAVFFLVVGLEVKRELLVGELRDRRQALLPIVAAAGGMVLPALVYVAFNPSGPETAGWGIPMATDIAFAIGVLALVAPSIPPALRLFLLTLAIVDDIGAILVIAVFYSSSIDVVWLGVAGLIVATVLVLRRVGRMGMTPFVLLGGALWVALFESGVHPTMAGVAMGLLAPTDQLERLEHRLHAWSGFVIVPVFALANAGIELTADALDRASSSSVTLGVAAGLVVGKAVGIAGTTWAVVRLGWADVPSGANRRQLLGVAALGGIGFTVSLFITGLAFDTPALVDEAKIGVLAASVLATLVGGGLLRAGRSVERAAG